MLTTSVPIRPQAEENQGRPSTVLIVIADMIRFFFSYLPRWTTSVRTVGWSPHSISQSKRQKTAIERAALWYIKNDDGTVNDKCRVAIDQRSSIIEAVERRSSRWREPLVLSRS